MLDLLRSELRRLTARRLSRIFAALALLVVVLVEVRTFATSSRDLEGARRRVEREAGLYTAQGGNLGEMCVIMQNDGQLAGDVDCSTDEGRLHAASQMGFFQDPRLQGRNALPDGAQAVAVGVAIIAFVLGASYVGADWHHGTMQALLFWEPRRHRVLVAKALALITVVVAFTAALQLVTYGLTYLTAATRGSTEGVTGGLQMSVLLMMLRGMIVVVVSALLGFAVAGLARVTAASLAVAYGYFVILENLMRGFRPGWRRFLFTENVAAVMLKRTEVPRAGATQDIYFDETVTPYFLTGVRGAVTLTIYLGLLLGAFYVTFARRDVT